MIIFRVNLVTSWHSCSFKCTLYAEYAIYVLWAKRLNFFAILFLFLFLQWKMLHNVIMWAHEKAIKELGEWHASWRYITFLPAFHQQHMLAIITSSYFSAKEIISFNICECSYWITLDVYFLVCFSSLLFFFYFTHIFSNIFIWKFQIFKRNKMFLIKTFYLPIPNFLTPLFITSKYPFNI